MTLSRDRSLQILNTQYAVFFGVIFGLSFYLTAADPSAAPSIRPTIPSDRLIPFLLLCAYYVLDWFTANVVPESLPEFSVIELFLYVAGVVLLGVVIILSNGMILRSLFLFGVYGIIVAFYDISVATRAEDLLGYFGFLLAGIRLLLGAVLAGLSGIVLFDFEIPTPPFDDRAGRFFLLTLVGLKLLRLGLLLRSIPTAAPTQIPMGDKHDA